MRRARRETTHRNRLAMASAFIVVLACLLGCDDFCIDPSGRGCYGDTQVDFARTSIPAGACPAAVTPLACDSREDCPVHCCSCATADGGVAFFGQQACVNDATRGQSVCSDL